MLHLPRHIYHVSAMPLVQRKGLTQNCSKYGPPYPFSHHPVAVSVSDIFTWPFSHQSLHSSRLQPCRNCNGHSIIPSNHSTQSESSCSSPPARTKINTRKLGWCNYVEALTGQNFSVYLTYPYLLSLGDQPRF
jgi:hypothetical protein